MRLDDVDHTYDCRPCRHTGAPCMEALWLGRGLARGIRRSRHALPADFEIGFETRFTGCGRVCPVRLRLTGAGVEVACGGEPGGPCLAAVVVAGASAPAGRAAALAV